jgi:hypothetical protein
LLCFLQARLQPCASDNIWHLAIGRVAMDLAQKLVKTVVRAFYDTREIVIVDAIIYHSWFVSPPMMHATVPNSPSSHERRLLVFLMTTWRT